MYRSKETDSKIFQSLRHLSFSEDTFAKAKKKPDFTSLSSNCNDVTLIYIYINGYMHMTSYGISLYKNKCSNDIYRFRTSKSSERSFRQTMRATRIWWQLFSSDPVRMNFEHSWNTMPRSCWEITGWTKNNNTTVTCIIIYSYHP